MPPETGPVTSPIEPPKPASNTLNKTVPNNPFNKLPNSMNHALDLNTRAAQAWC